MSNDVRLFFRLAFFIPFGFFLFIVFRGYANYQFAQSLELCASKYTLSFAKDEQAELREFVGCLHKNNNAVGRWQAKRDKISFAIELKANGKFKIDDESMAVLNKQEENEYTEGYQGVWSSPSKNTIMWFVSNRIWPIDENKVEWQNADQLVIHERTGEQTYYQRQSAHIANCPYYP